ncbi:ERI1 exoribonuclease 2 [Saimiri boliviensis]|uniref:ERI1 exoribonuclease 2 n=1 Tax=Saimiri boliviensis boliviensis TaxID=39432 RepID=A0A2K6RY61_SAIBB|nr:ERI1 exoribonuclease 2 isoform X1 [Saimiri boliviensis boliviensis]XP_010339056.1 ERI1 exoribonuclease 2 isoform X1 [Saimiri boliviensis boliviensis]
MATKRLARQLGLIRRKSIASANGNLGRSKSKQLFDYLIVIDFESTCWNDGKRHHSQEIIEFPAVLLNTSTGQIESEFHAYVQPQEQPILSEFCMELTGIKQAQVDEGVPLKICLSQFCKWIHKIQQQKKIIFAAGVSEPSTSEVNLCAFVTWSDWDLGVCLEYECKRKQLLKPVFLNSWIDLRSTYKLFYRRKPKGLSGALQEVGIEFSGREHSGLDDSRNTALLAWKMIRDGCLMKITRSLNKVPTKKNSSILARNLKTNQVEEMSACNSIQGPSIYDKEPKNTINSREKVQMKSVCANFPVKAQKDQLQVKNTIKTGLHSVKSCLSIINSKSSTSLGHLQSPTLNSPIYMQKQGKNEHLAFNTKSKSSTVGSELVLVSTTIPTVNHVSDMEMSSTLDCLPMLADWEDVVLLPASQPEKNIDYTVRISDSDLAISFNSGERLMVLKESEMPSHENFGDVEKTLQKSETSKSIVYKSPHTTIYNVKEAKDPGSDVSAFKLPEHRSSTCNRVKANMSHPLVLGKHPPPSDGTKRNPCSPQAFPPAKKQPFTIHEEKPMSSDCSPVRSSSRKLFPSVLTSIVNLQEPWKSGKMTPPLCKCGRRSRRLVVSNNGPNHGKVFYCCPIGKYQENRKCCGYFRWEQTLQKERANSIVPFHSTGELTFNSPETSHLRVQNLSISTRNSLRLRPSMRN